MRKLLKFVAVVVVGLVVGLAAFGYREWGRLNEPYKGYPATEQFVDIPPGTTVAGIGRRLAETGVVRDTVIFRVALWRSGRPPRLKAGEYRFSEPSTAAAVIDRLARGDVYTRRITFPEGLTIAEMAKLYASRGFGLAADFSRAAKDASAIVDLDPQAPDLEGYLFPETYALARGTPASSLVRTMVDRFKAVFGSQLRRRAEQEGLTVRQAVTMAALIEKETGQEEERTLVAAVYRNRLKIGMPMQADPTLIYALEKAGRYDGNIRKTDFDFASPYTTDRYPGLPPGPIAAPGKASLTAALNPADVRYLYFVSRNDHTHVFAETLAKHNANVRKFQVQYFRQQRLGPQSGGRGQGEGGRAVPGNRHQSQGGSSGKGR